MREYNFFRLTHEYDMGDRSLYFTFDATGLDVTAKELAVYLQFKAENMFDETISLGHITIIRFLSLFGAKQLDTKPNEKFETIDMYWDRESRCGDWYSGRFVYIDQKFNDKASAFLNAEVNENQLMGEWYGI